MKTATHISLFRVVLAIAVKDSQRLWPRTGSLVFVLLIVCLWSSSGSVFGDDGSKPTDSAKKAPRNEPVGCLLAPGMITLLEDEIKAGLKRREIEPDLLNSPATPPRPSTTRPTGAVGRSFPATAG